MTAFLELLPLILKVLPGVISFIEQVMGPGNGAAKLAAAVQLTQDIIPEVAPHLTDDPKKLAQVQAVISTGVKFMNAAGMLPTADKG